MYEKDRFEQIQMKYIQSDESSWNLMMGGSFLITASLLITMYSASDLAATQLSFQNKSKKEKNVVNLRDLLWRK